MSDPTLAPDVEDIEEAKLRAEYSIWKKNTPFLYDLILTTRLTWPSLTVEWLPEVQTLIPPPTDSTDNTNNNGLKSKDLYTEAVMARYKLLLGTQTSGKATEFVRIGRIDLPNLSVYNTSTPRKFFSDFISTESIKKESAISSNHNSAKANSAPLFVNPQSLMNKYDSNLQEFGGYQLSSNTQFKIHQYLDHFGEVNRTRYLPQNPNIIATGSSNGNIYIYDCTKHPLDPRDNFIGSSNSIPDSDPNKSKLNDFDFYSLPARPRPDLILEGHQNEVSALSWNHHRYGKLASGNYDHSVAIWDIRSWSKSATKNSSSLHNKQEDIFGSNTSNQKGSSAPINRIVSPTLVMRTHKNLVNDVEWHRFNPFVLGSVSDDGEIHIHDTRIDTATRTPQMASIPIVKTYKRDASASSEVEKVAINCMSFNFVNENLLATGGSDANIYLWDIRSLSTPLHAMHGHSDNVNAVEWSPHESTILASASSDRRVCIWDVSRIDEREVSSEGLHSVSKRLSNRPQKEVKIKTEEDNRGSIHDDPMEIDTDNNDKHEKVPLSDSTKQKEEEEKKEETKIKNTNDPALFMDPNNVSASNKDTDYTVRANSAVSTTSDYKLLTGENLAAPPELLWVHGGHTESVSDVAWNPALPWVLASVSNDNRIHIYQPAKNIVGKKN